MTKPKQHNNPKPLSTKDTTKKGNINNTNKTGNHNSKVIVCWNCGQPNHVHADCRVRRERFCYRCSKINETVRTCRCLKKLMKRVCETGHHTPNLGAYKSNYRVSYRPTDAGKEDWKKWLYIVRHFYKYNCFPNSNNQIVPTFSKHAYDNRPLIEVKIYYYLFTVLLDLGANRSVIGECGKDLLKKFDLKIDKSDQLVTLTVVSNDLWTLFSV